ncbi:MAG: preprotein translocase subunit SecE [Candidatus Brocadiaceae bacterium]|jgi:preprotein translocase SecE subunit
MAAAGAFLLLALFACVRLFQIARPRLEGAQKVLGMVVPYAAILAAGVFLVVGVGIFLLTVGPETGIGWLDKRTHSVVDLLVETQAELAKVSWPGSEELTRSTTAVLVSIVLLGVFLFVWDWIVALVMGTLGVLPK